MSTWDPSLLSLRSRAIPCCSRRFASVQGAALHHSEPSARNLSHFNSPGQGGIASQAAFYDLEGGADLIGAKSGKLTPDWELEVLPVRGLQKGPSDPSKQFSFAGLADRLLTNQALLRNSIAFLYYTPGHKGHTQSPSQSRVCAGEVACFLCWLALEADFWVRPGGLHRFALLASFSWAAGKPTRQ